MASPADWLASVPATAGTRSTRLVLPCQSQHFIKTTFDCSRNVGSYESESVEYWVPRHKKYILGNKVLILDDLQVHIRVFEVLIQYFQYLIHPNLGSYYNKMGSYLFVLGSFMCFDKNINRNLSLVLIQLNCTAQNWFLFSHPVIGQVTILFIGMGYNKE